MEINQMKTVKVNAKTLKLHLKVCDRFTATLLDADGATLKEQDDGYVPSFMPGNHYGDYVILDIDIDTGNRPWQSRQRVGRVTWTRTSSRRGSFSKRRSWPRAGRCELWEKPPNPQASRKG